MSYDDEEMQMLRWEQDDIDEEDEYYEQMQRAELEDEQKYEARDRG